MAEKLNLLWQIHHQEKHPPYRSEMVAQSKFEGGSPQRFMAWMTEWAEGVAQRHPLPEGKQWLFCNENAPEFTWAVVTQEQAS